MSQERPAKRRHVYEDAVNMNDISSTESEMDFQTEAENTTDFFSQAIGLNSLDRTVTPPPGIGVTNLSENPPFDAKKDSLDDDIFSTSKTIPRSRQSVRSPVGLTKIRGLPANHNVDTVTLSDILCDPMIKEVWIFNYLHDVSFTIEHLDPDVRDTVQVKIIHGSWKREDPHRMGVEEDAKQYKNVQVIIAHMPEMFGTHHSKSFVLLRHDDLAQIVIHTANMIQQDWTNLTQAVWRSPLLPLLDSDPGIASQAPLGSGQRFKTDFINYLRAYQSRTKPLVEQLNKFDFSTIRAALIASVPCKQSIESASAPETRFGWSGLRHILKAVPSRQDTSDTGPPQLVIQISSVGNLGAKDKWFDPFLKSLAVTAEQTAAAVSTWKLQGSAKLQSHIIFPTTNEVRRSLDGYAAGASIHMKLGNKAMQTQLTYMRPMLKHWAGNGRTDMNTSAAGGYEAVREASRRRAAPHIKTYIRFSDASMERIDWAMLTSANLSKQAWGEAAKDDGSGREVRIASYELGVVVWPALFEDGFGDASNAVTEKRGGKAVMVPVFGMDQPSQEQVAAVGGDVDKVVGFRMPYDLPLVRYAKDELPWCATAEHHERDLKGVIWEGYSRRA